MVDLYAAPDLEPFLTARVRAALPGYGFPGVKVGTRPPVDSSPTAVMPPLRANVWVQSLDRVDAFTWRAGVGVSVTGGDLATVERPAALARIVFAVLDQCATPEAGNPVAAVESDGTFGPYQTGGVGAEARLYGVVSMIVVGDRIRPV